MKQKQKQKRCILFSHVLLNKRFETNFLQQKLEISFELRTFCQSTVCQSSNIWRSCKGKVFVVYLLYFKLSMNV